MSVGGAPGRRYPAAIDPRTSATVADRRPRRRWAAAARGLLVLLVLGLLVRATLPHLRDVGDALTPQLGLALAVVALGNVGANVILSDNWSRVLRLLSADLPTPVARRIWGRAQMARYAVGSAQLLSRPALARRAGVPLRVGVTSTLLETVWMAAVTATGVLATAPTWLPVAEDDLVLQALSAVGVLALVALTLAPRLTLTLPLALLRRVGRPIELSDRHGTRAISGWYVANALLRTAGFALLVGVAGDADLVTSTLLGAAAFLTGNLVGLLVVFAPGGLGPREAVSALLLQPVLGPGAIIAVLAGVRLAELTAEALFILVFRGPTPAPEG